MKPFEAINSGWFFERVDSRPGLGPDGDCHFWSSFKAPSGAGLVTLRTANGTVNFKAHRVAHWLAYGRMPDELFCIHACGEPSCVNPRHLYLSVKKKGIAPARIMRWVDQRPGQGPNGDCWEFQGHRQEKMAYGSFSGDEGRFVTAHRYMFELVNGPLPKGAMVLHRCDNAPCCRPDHLYVGDHAQNMRDRSSRGRTASTRGNFKLSEEQARAIKFHDDRRPDVIAAEYGVSRATVVYIKAGTRWVNLTR
jgi:hypothetical protein